LNVDARTAPRGWLADLVQFEALIGMRRDDPRHAGSAVSMERLGAERMPLLLLKRPRLPTA
jgi:DNA-binding transcriptional LysR family regulator